SSAEAASNTLSRALPRSCAEPGRCHKQERKDGKSPRQAEAQIDERGKLFREFQPGERKAWVPSLHGRQRDQTSGTSSVRPTVRSRRTEYRRHPPRAPVRSTRPPIKDWIFATTDPRFSAGSGQAPGTTRGRSRR